MQILLRIMFILHTSFFTAEEIVTIKMFKAIYSQQFALSLTHLIAKQMQKFVTCNRKLSNNIVANSNTSFFHSCSSKMKNMQWPQHLVHTVKLSFENIRDHFRAFSCLLPGSQNVGISHTISDKVPHPKITWKEGKTTIAHRKKIPQKQSKPNSRPPHHCQSPWYTQTQLARSRLRKASETVASTDREYRWHKPAQTLHTTKKCS